MSTQQRHGKHLLIFTMTILASTLLVLWTWNTAIAALFDLPILEFRQALALVILLIVASFFFGGSHPIKYRRNFIHWHDEVKPGEEK